MPLVRFDRATMLGRLADEAFDLVVVGGGITGVGVALDAAARGYRTALVERDDLGSGTSSKSSKLVHGGLRYLQQGEVRLVYDALHERQRLRRNAPHLVRVMPFLLPIFGKDGLINPKVARALGSALWSYDLTGGWRIGRLHQRLDRDEVLAHVPSLRADRVVGGYLYFDAQADDARLCLTVARTAASCGAVVATRAQVVGVRHDGRRATGVVVEADGRRIDVRARVVVNAAGVWADEVRTLDEAADPDAIRPAKGVHLTVAWDKLRNDIAAVVPVPKDKRSLFVVPWGEHTYIGTTDTDHHGPLDDPRCTKDDIEYVLRGLNASLATPLTPADVTGVWAGLRPLVKRASAGRTADLSRRHAVSVSTSGMVSVTGGKLTTYREMAADAVDEAERQLGTHRRSPTRRLRLLGADGFDDPPEDDRSTDAHLARRYGGEAAAVRALVAADARLAEPLVPGLPYLRAEAVHAVRHEMAGTLDDVLSRRTRARLLDREATLAAAPEVARLLAPELGWDDATRERAVAELRSALEAEAASGRHSEAELALDRGWGA